MTMMVIAISDNLSPESSSFNPEDMDIESKWATNLLECLKLFYREHCVYLPAMAGWFIFSALLSSYNKLVFGAGHIAFPCPLLLTSIHFFIQWTFSWSISTLFPKALGGDRVQEMSWREYLSVSIPCGIVTSGDVGMSNLAIVRISITFYTMIKASTPVFVLAWAYMFGIEKITFPLILVVAIIASGEFLTVVGETEFDLAGFLLCLTASCLSGARWTLVQLKIKSLDPPLKTTVATMRVLSPSMFASMLLIALIVEKPWTLGGEGYFDDLAQVLHTLALGLLGAIFAIAMILCEFSLIMKASAIILMLGGVIKEMMTIIVGVEFFHDSLNRINVWGCFTVFVGVIIYKVQFHFAKQAKEATTEGDEPLVEMQSKLRYRQLKDHFSDDEDDFEDDALPDGEVDVVLPDEEGSLKAIEIEMPIPHRRASINATLPNGVDHHLNDSSDGSCSRASPRGSPQIV